MLNVLEADTNARLGIGYRFNSLRFINFDSNFLNLLNCCFL
jgi:hypothetical protein